MTSQNHGSLTKIELSIIKTLRESGFCVVVFTPEEMGNTSVRKLEEIITQTGNHIIKSDHC